MNSQTVVTLESTGDKRKNTMKDILVHLNNKSTLGSRLWAAKQLANNFSAHITGLHVKRPMTYEIYGTPLHPDITAQFSDREDEAAKESHEFLQAQCNDNANKADYIECTGDPSHHLTKHASTFDVVVLEQPATGQDYEQSVALPVNVALGCGRPVLIVPEKIERDTLGEQVLVAWNGTPEATRALHDAMPLLTTAKSVNVVVFHPPKTHLEDMQDKPLEDHLRRHGITFDILDTIAEDHSVGNGIIEFVDKYDADLVVMGAYGHSRIREYVLGGVSRTMIRDVQVPLFLSH